MKKLFKRKIFWLPLFFIICIGLLFSLGLDDVLFSQHEIRIGLLAELSGSMKPIGVSSQRGVTLAISQVNAAGGVMINGTRYPIRLVTVDNKSNMQESQKDVMRLHEDHVAAIIGPNVSEYALAAGKVAEDNNIVLISPWSTDDNTTRSNVTSSHSIFRAAFTESFQEKALAYFVSNKLQADKAAIIYDARQPVLKQQADYFTKQLISNHGIIIDTIGFTNPQNLSQQLSTLISKKPDIIFLPAYAQDAAAIMNQLRKINTKIPVIGSDAWNDGQLVKICGQDCNGSYVASHMNSQSQNEITRDFISTYQKQFKTTPDDVAADSYDAANIIIQAISNAKGTSYDDITNAMHAIENFNGVTGSITYSNKSNDPQKNIYINKIENGNLVFIQSISSKDLEQ